MHLRGSDRGDSDRGDEKKGFLLLFLHYDDDWRCPSQAYLSCQQIRWMGENSGDFLGFAGIRSRHDAHNIHGVALGWA